MMNEFFSSYQNLSLTARCDIGFSRKQVLHLNNRCNEIDKESVGTRLTFILFFSFFLIFLISVPRYDLNAHIDNTRGLLVGFLDTFPKGLPGDFAQSMFFFFLLCVPGLLFIKLAAWIFFRKSHNWLIQLALGVKIRSSYFSIWFLLAANFGPILALAVFPDNATRSAITKALLDFLFIETTGLFGSIAGLTLVWILNSLTKLPEQLLIELLVVQKQLDNVDLANSDSVRSVVYRIKRLSDQFGRAEYVRYNNDKFKRISNNLRLFGDWLRVPYPHTPGNIQKRLTPMIRGLGFGNFADIPATDEQAPPTGEPSRLARLFSVAGFLIFVAMPVVAVFLLTSGPGSTGNEELRKLFLTIFFVIWSLVGAYVFVRRTFPDLFDDLRKAIGGFSK